MENKVAIMPCNGVGQVFATITRESAYKIHSLRPEKTILLSSPDLATDNPDALEIAKKYPVIVIDGCKEKCGGCILKTKGISPIFEIFAPKICGDKKISIGDETRAKLGKKGNQLVEAISKIAVEAVDKTIEKKFSVSRKNISKKLHEKVCIFPSSELTTVFGKIARQASYAICGNLCPEKTVLCCMPALYAGVQEDIDFIIDFPVITLEGHPMHHAAKLVKKYSQDVAIEIDIEKLLKDNNIVVSDSTPEKLGQNGEKAVKFLSEHTSKIVNDLLKKEDN